jgi:hypothetical protein
LRSASLHFNAQRHTRGGRFSVRVAFDVGILGGVEAAVGCRHAPGKVAGEIDGHVVCEGLTHDRIVVGIEPDKLGIVVEHLLEMRDGPVRLGAVAVHPAAKMVVDGAKRHGIKRFGDSLKRLSSAVYLRIADIAGRTRLAIVGLFMSS